MQIWIVTGNSESGDSYGPLAFSTPPTEAKLSEIAHDWDGDEDHSGCGSYGSYVYIEVCPVVLDEVK